MRLRLAALGNEVQRHAVVAPALAGGRRAIIEDMAVVAAAADAVIFGAGQNELVISSGAEYPRDRRKETRPTGAALIFHLGGKRRQIASDTHEDAGTFFIVQRARAGPLGAFLAQHIELRRVQTLAPFFF